MKVKIKFLNGNINIYEPKNCNILNLKQEIINDKNILLEDIKLIYRGKILQNNENFEFHKIDENSILHCVIKKKKIKYSSTNN